MAVAATIKKKRKAAHITQSDLAYKVGVSDKTVRRWESGERVPGADDLLRLADTLDTSVAYLMGETDDPESHHTPSTSAWGNAPSPAVMKMFAEKAKIFSSPGFIAAQKQLSLISPEQIQAFAKFAEFQDASSRFNGKISALSENQGGEVDIPQTLPLDLVTQQHEQKGEVTSNVATMNDAMMIPVVTSDVSACCGKGNMYAEDVKWEIVGYYPMDPNDLLGYTWQTGNFCIIRVDGDSMEPHFHEGDRVLFAKSPDVEIKGGDFAILLWDDKLLIRGVIFPDENKVILRPTNNKYDDIEARRGDGRLCFLGKVLGVTPAYRKTPGLW